MKLTFLATSHWPLATLLVCVGCSKLATAEGQVLLNGAPLDGASVTFVPVDEKGSGFIGGNGITDEQGMFRVKGVREFGIAPGEYKVTVSKYELPPGVKAPDTSDPDAYHKWQSLRTLLRESIPAVYTDPSQTPLAVTIPAGGRKDISLAVSTDSASSP